MKDLCIRFLRTEERALLATFLYEAIYVPEGMTPPPHSVVMQPALQVYIENFGASIHDVAFVAEVYDGIIGMAWSRLMNDYGHIDDATPSLAIAVHRDYRGKGVGTALLFALLTCLCSRGYERVSLSVHQENPAVRLYQKMGFQILQVKQEEYIMVLTFCSAAWQSAKKNIARGGLTYEN